jgi:hypothetical protein
MKLKHILENKILIPRRSKEERRKNLAVIHYKQIQEYIKNGSEGSLDLTGTPLKILPPNLIRVGGSLFLQYSQITSLNNLEIVEGDVYLDDSQITSLGNLKRAHQSLTLEGSQITSLGNLEYVGSFLQLDDSKIESLGNLKFIGYSFFLRNTPISKTHTEEQIRQQVRIIGWIRM